MEDVKEIKTDATKVSKTKKRSTLHTVLTSILLVLLFGVLAGAGWWVYDTYMTTPEQAAEVETVTSGSTKSAEEKELDTISQDLEKDDNLSTDDLENEVNDLNGVDTSGI